MCDGCGEGYRASRSRSSKAERFTFFIRLNVEDFLCFGVWGVLMVMLVMFDGVVLGD